MQQVRNSQDFFVPTGFPILRPKALARHTRRQAGTPSFRLGSAPVETAIEHVRQGLLAMGQVHFALLLLVNAAAFVAMGYDKWCAGRGARRVPEARLILPVWFGGVLGMWLAMGAFRHKTQKRSFQVWMWGAAAVSLVLWALGLGLWAALGT